MPREEGRGQFFQVGYHLCKLKIASSHETPKYAFLHAFFFIFCHYFLPKFVNKPKTHSFFKVWKFLHPKQWTRIHCLVMKNCYYYMFHFTKMIYRRREIAPIYTPRNQPHRHWTAGDLLNFRDWNSGSATKRWSIGRTCFMNLELRGHQIHHTMSRNTLLLAVCTALPPPPHVYKIT